MGQHYIWVGNIPYTTTQEEIREIMATVGPVLSVRIRYDKDSGQSKGFAFCEYENEESCALAIKHLHGTVVGGRQIRLDFCSNEQSRSYFLETQRSGESNDNIRPSHIEQREQPQTTQSSIRVQIAQIVQSLSAAQLFYLLGHMQKFILASPDYARSILRENPSLCYALLHAQFICGMVDDPFSPIDDIEILDKIEQERIRQQMEEARRLYERSSESWLQKAESMLPDNQPDNQPIILNPPVTQIPRPQYGMYNLPFDNRNPIPPIPPPHLYHTMDPMIAPPNPQIVDQILAHPEILQQILSITPEQEAAWSHQERIEMTNIRMALRHRGLQI